MASKKPKKSAVEPLKTTCSGIDIYDLSPYQVEGHPKTKRWRGRTVRRKLEDVTGVCVHQTDVTFGVARYQIKEAGGDAERAQVLRALNVAAHMTVFNEGWAVQAFPWESYVNGGNGFNSFCLHLEIEGRYRGLTGDPRTGPSNATGLDGLTYKTACEGLRYMVESAREAGAPIADIFCHRQSSATRRRDPGQEIYEAVVLGFAPTIGLTPRPLRVMDAGRPVPRQWDPSGAGQY